MGAEKLRTTADGTDLQRARDGDRQAMNRLLQRHKGLAYSIALKYVSNPADAEDIVQEAFVNVFLHIGQFRQESVFTTWLYRIVYREALRLLKRSSRYVSIREETLDSYGTAEPAMLEWEQVAEVRRRMDGVRLGMQQLSANEYLVINLFYLAEKDIREIATMTGHSPANIKVLLHRARKKLAGLFENNIKSSEL